MSEIKPLLNREVLIIDDDADAREMISKILTKEGFKVTLAKDTAEAVKLSDLNPPHLVIVDLNLPGEGGLEFLQRKGSIQSLKLAQFLVVSANTDAASSRQAIALGADDYVTKPFRTHILVQKVRKALKDQRYAKIDLYPGSYIPVQASIKAKVLLVKETGFVMQVPIKIAEGERVEIKSVLLDQLGMSHCVFQTANQPPISTLQTQSFIVDVTALGITEEMIRKLKSRKEAA